LLHRASRILSKAELSAGMLTDTIEQVLAPTQPLSAQ
jgi:hypothetical protein